MSDPDLELAMAAADIKAFLAAHGPATREECWAAVELQKEIRQNQALYNLLAEGKVTVKEIPASGDIEDALFKAVSA